MNDGLKLGIAFLGGVLLGTLDAVTLATQAMPEADGP